VTCRLCGRSNRSGPFCRGSDKALVWCYSRARARLGMSKGLCAAWRARDEERISVARGRA
jgi:hypothetical protein